MNKPQWVNAPEWAEYLAMDEDGEWYWYEFEPYQMLDCWANSGRMQFAGSQEVSWIQTKERHP